jgi:hypothetical protein
MDVPEMAFVDPLFQADVIETPGAKMSTQVPKFENDARLSEESLAATVSAEGVRAGDVLHASAFELPAATATVTPSAITA